MSFASTEWTSSFTEADRLLRSENFTAASDLYRTLAATDLQSVRAGTEASVVSVIAKNRLGICEALLGRPDVADSLFGEVDGHFHADDGSIGGAAFAYLQVTMRHLQAERAVVFKGVEPVRLVDEIAICQHGCPIPWPPPCGLAADHCQ